MKDEDNQIIVKPEIILEVSLDTIQKRTDMVVDMHYVFQE